MERLLRAGPGARVHRNVSLITEVLISSVFVSFFRQISTQVVAAMATAVGDVCSRSSALRWGRAGPRGPWQKAWGMLSGPMPGPAKPSRRFLARPDSVSTLGIGAKCPVPQPAPATYGLRGGRTVVPLPHKVLLPKEGEGDSGQVKRAVVHQRPHVHGSCNLHTRSHGAGWPRGAIPQASGCTHCRSVTFLPYSFSKLFLVLSRFVKNYKCRGPWVAQWLSLCFWLRA